MSEDNNYQLMDDWIRSSIITVDGIDFAVCGFDDESSFSKEDLQEGLQDRIHGAIVKIADALNIADCRSINT